MLKQRLIGAAVLVALAVIFIPMILEDPDPTVPDMRAMPEDDALPRGGELRDLDVGEDRALALPPIGAVSEREAAELAELAPAAGAPGPVDMPPPAEPLAEAPAETAPVEAVPVEAAPTVPEQVALAEPQAAVVPDKAPAAQPEAVTGALGNWVIQVGSFGSQANATTLRDRLRGDGYATQVERVVLDSGETFRVRVGPYLDKTEAEGIAAKLGKAHGLTPRVMSYP